MMLILITGGCKNGKSKLAERIICSYLCKRFYIATMLPYGEEANATIERHHKIRQEKCFQTIEKYTDISEINIPKNSSILLECLANLCANEMFENICSSPANKIICDVKSLLKYSKIFAVITNQIGSDGIKYPSETENYIIELSKLNANLAKVADVVIETVLGIPVLLKGEMPKCLY